MRWARIRELFRKDFEELRTNRAVFASLFVLPAILMIEGIAYALGKGSSIAPGTPGAAAAFVQGAQLSLDLLLLVPLLIATTIGANSIVQEKTTRSLEPLLATPITDTELLIGKALTPLVPGLVALWVCYTGIFAVVDAVAWPVTGTLVLPNGPALFQMWIEGPLLALVGTFAILAISSWAKDARAAQQLSMVVVLPILISILLLLLVFPSFGAQVAFALALALAAYGLFRLALRRFDRPEILVTWR